MILIMNPCDFLRYWAAYLDKNGILGTNLVNFWNTKDDESVMNAKITIDAVITITYSPNSKYHIPIIPTRVNPNNV